MGGVFIYSVVMKKFIILAAVVAACVGCKNVTPTTEVTYVDTLIIDTTIVTPTDTVVTDTVAVVDTL